jgi:adenylosuccinate lyase
MIERYTLPAMAAVWTEERKFRAWLEVEIAVCEVLAERGEIPAEAVEVIKRKADFTVERIHEIEKETRHDVIAFTTAVAEHVGPESRFIHLGLTSTDVVDTAQALQVREASNLIQAELETLLETVKKQALRYRHTPMIGRTHGVHAEPTTMGLKLAVWYSELQRHLERFKHARANLEVGKISGPVGSYTHLPPDVEEAACQKLGLPFAKVSTQTLQRDRHAEYICSLAMLGATYDKMATEIRHLQRTEVREAAESFAKGQKGSSSMPHKRNPVTCEQISGLSRVLRANVVVALDNVPLWHERDISHSSAERVILPDSTTLAHYLTVKVNRVIGGLDVDAEQMLRNLGLMRGLIFSGALLLQLARKGVLRETAYQWIQRNAMRVWDEDADFRSLILADPDIRLHLTEEEILRTFDYQEMLKHVDRVFERVFGEG